MLGEDDEIVDFDLFTPAITSPVDPDIKVLRGKNGLRRGIRPFEPSFAYTMDGVCEIMDISKNVFHKMRREGLPTKKIKNGLYMVLGSEIIDWIKGMRGDYNYDKYRRPGGQEPLRPNPKL